MATVTHLVTTPDTGNTPNTSGSFTPAVGDLIIVFVTKETSGAMASADLTASVAPTAFTLIHTDTYRSGADILGIFVADGLTTNTTSRTVTITAGSDAAAGTIISVYGVSGMTATGASAVRSHGGQSDQAATTTPAPVLDQTPLTTSCCLSVVANATNPAGITNAPASWTKSQDTGYASGVTGLATAFRNSGQTGATITWGTASASIFASIAIELTTVTPLTLQVSDDLNAAF